MPCSAQNVETAPRGASSGHCEIARRTRGSMGSLAATAEASGQKCHHQGDSECHRCPDAELSPMSCDMTDTLEHSFERMLDSFEHMIYRRTCVRSNVCSTASPIVSEVVDGLQINRTTDPRRRSPAPLPPEVTDEHHHLRPDAAAPRGPPLLAGAADRT